MANALDRLKKRNNLEDLQKRLETESKKSYEQDDSRMWYPKLDKSGNALAVIRFLPVYDPDDEDALDWVKLYSHGFQGDNGLWYIENCPTTLPDGTCPCCESNVKLYKTGNESDKKIAQSRKRKLHYYTNVYVISDPTNPEAEGTVKIFRFGATIFDKIKGAIKPEFADETPIDPFNMWNGANFKLKIRKVDGEIKYDKSEFDKSSALASTDAEIEKIWQQGYALKEFISPDKFKTYEKLTERLHKVLEIVSKDEIFESKTSSRKVIDQDDDDKEFDMKIDENISENDEFGDLEAEFQKLAS
uniref:Bacteriophage T4 Gp32 single-stranded DNA-binding domain-containing protein n=1 Tax=viral metagenome TaxID=1070528 RepID=A0A6C0JWN2_9ZZZZ